MNPQRYRRIRRSLVDFTCQPYVTGHKARIGWWLTFGEESPDGIPLAEGTRWRPSFMVDWTASRYLDRWDRRNREPS